MQLDRRRPAARCRWRWLRARRRCKMRPGARPPPLQPFFSEIRIFFSHASRAPSGAFRIPQRTTSSADSGTARRPRGTIGGYDRVAGAKRATPNPRRQAKAAGERQPSRTGSIRIRHMWRIRIGGRRITCEWLQAANFWCGLPRREGGSARWAGGRPEALQAGPDRTRRGRHDQIQGP